MLALKEFANFMTLNVANLAMTYDRLLAETKPEADFRPADNRGISARRLIKTAAETLESGTSAPLSHLFEERANQAPPGQEAAYFSQLLLEIEILGQTLTPAVTNLEAGRFLWQALSETRQLFLQRLPITPAQVAPTLIADPQILDKKLQYLSYFVESSQVAQVGLDAQAKIQYVNPAFCSLYGYQTEELLDQPVSILSGEESPQVHYLDLLETVARQNAWYGESQRKRKDGSTFPASITFSTVRHPSGEIVAYLDISRDVTEHRNEQDKLRQLSQAVEQSPSLVIITNTAGQIDYVNPKFCQLTGYTPTEVIGQNPRILKSGETPADEYKNLWQAIVSGGEWRGELHNKTKNGEFFWVSSHISPIKNAAGVVTHYLSIQEDVTARKQAEETLAQLLAQHNTILENVSVGIAHLANRRFAWMNEKMTEMFGYTLDEVKSVSTEAFYPSREDFEQLGKDAYPLLSQGKTYSTERLMKRKDGSLFWCTLSGKAIPGGQASGSIWILQDISERRRAEQMMQESQQRLSLLVRQSPLAIIEWNTAFEVADWNPAAERIFGYTREEALGRHAAGLIVPEEVRPLVDQVWQGLLAQKGGTRSTNDNFTKEGRLITCDWYNTPLIGAEGQVIGVASLVDDITERKQAEEILNQERILLRTLIDNIPGYIYAKDAQSRFMMGNQAVTALMGAATPTDLTGKTDFDFFPAEIADQFYADEQEIIRTGQSILNKEEIAQNPLQNQIWLSTSKIPLRDSQGQIIGLVGVGQDITQRKQLELQVQKSLAQSTRQARLSALVAQDTATITDLPSLFQQVTAEIGKQFGYYHTQLLLTDPMTNSLISIADYGQMGQRLLTQNQPIALDNNPVSRAAALGVPVRWEDGSTTSNWRSHPLLPDTHSELALPLKMGLSDSKVQVAALKRFITAGLDGFVVFSIDPAAVAPVAKEAIDQGLRVVAKGGDLGQANQTAVVLVEEYEVGYILGTQAGEWAKKNLPAAKTLTVGVLNYCVLPGVAQREEGIIAGIRAAYGDNFAIVGNETASDSVLALTLVEGWLRQFDDLDMVVAINDSGALGAYRAATAAGKNNPDTFFVGGVDGVAEALELIKAGEIYQATVDVSPVVMGVTAVRSLVAAIIGQPYEPITLLKGRPVNRSNIDQFWGVERPMPPDERLTGLDLSGLKVGLSVMTLANPFFARLVEAVKHEAAQQGFELFINDPVEVLGVLDVKTTAAEELSFEDQLVLEGLCAQLALAVNNQRNLAAAQALTREQTVLNELGQALTTQLNVDQIVAETYRQASRLVDTTNFYIGLYDKATHQINFRLDVTESALDKSITAISADEGIAGYIIRHRADVLFEDKVKAQQEALGIPLIAQEALSWLGVPLLTGDQVLGVMAVQSYTTPGLYDSHSRDLLKAIASQVAIALQNARQFEEAHRRAHREQTIREITEKMRAATSLEQLVKITARELGDRTAAQYALVDLGLEAPAESAQPAVNDHKA